MSLLYLLDTNIISEPLKDKPNLQVINLINKYHSQLALPAFVVYEILKGAYTLPLSAKRTRILQYIDTILSQLPVLAYTEQAAIWHGKEMARLQKAGKTASFLDSQIAAVAQVNHLILVTRNTKDFQYFEGLNMTNWFE